MQTQKLHKIDLTLEYPCPCRRHGRLIPITLTEAFGCDRCQQIFVVQEGGYTIEQLSTHYPYKKVWRWTGRHWAIVHPNMGRGYLPVLMLTVLLAVAFLLLITTLQSILSSDVAFRIIAALVMVMLMLMLWVAYRH